MPAEVIAKKPCYLRSEFSPTCTRFCQRVYGEMLNQYGTADMDQLALMLEVLQLRAGSYVLDAGCGMGATTRYLSEKTQSRFLGIDTAEPAIRRASELASASPERLAFKLGDLNALDLSPASFDAVIVIDSLYFCKDLSATIAQFKNILRPAGQMALFYTHVADSPGGSLAAAHTKLGAALRANGIAFDVHDLSQNDRLFWLRSKNVAEELRADFASEGNGDLTRLSEADAMLDLMQQQRHARYLYHSRIQ